MKKGILIVALLVVPVGAALAWHEGKAHVREGRGQLGTQSTTIRQGEARLGTQTGTITTGGTTGEARLGTQTGTVTTRGTTGEAWLGSQRAETYQAE